MGKAYCYLRVSGLGQVDGFGFDRQEETCREYAKRNGLEIVGVFKEAGVSGTKDETERPAFQDLLAAILPNGIRTVLVESLDRLAREYRLQETLLIYLASKGISLVSARTGEDVTAAIMADPLQRALVQIQGVFSELEKNQLVRRLKKGRERAKKANGKCEGRKAYGETPEEAQVIRRIKAWRRTRKNGVKGATLQEIADRLNAEGVTTKDGSRWQPAQVHVLLKRRRTNP
jgi:site-specific DNA recombinase